VRCSSTLLIHSSNESTFPPTGRSSRAHGAKRGFHRRPAERQLKLIAFSITEPFQSSKGSFRPASASLDSCVPFRHPPDHRFVRRPRHSDEMPAQDTERYSILASKDVFKYYSQLKGSTRGSQKELLRVPNRPFRYYIVRIIHCS